MKKNILSNYDISERQQMALNKALSESENNNPSKLDLKSARHSLDQILTEEHTFRENDMRQPSLEEARFGKTLYEMTTSRDQTRILFISRDEGLLSGSTHSIDGYLSLGEVFDEVHIVLLRTSTAPVRFPVLRLSPKVWLYIANAKDWWRTPLSALDVIDEHLAFAGGFRADIIIAHDPFESAIVASIASTRYGRPYQLHIQHDFYHPKFLLTDDHPRVRRWVAWYLLRHANSIRTVSDQISQMIRQRFPKVLDVETLPRFNKYEVLTCAPVVDDVHRIYPDFSFTILYVGSLNYNNLIHQVIDGMRPLCEECNIGLIILGAGPAKSELEKRVKRLKLQRHIVFESAVTKQTDYIKTADALIVTDTTSASDELVIQAAVLNTVVVAVPTTIRTDLFEHNSSILFFSAGKTSMIATHLRELINDKALSTQLTRAAKISINERLYTNLAKYRRVYRESIEKVLFLGDEVGDTGIVKE